MPVTSCSQKKYFIGLSSKQFLWLLLCFNNMCVIFKWAYFCYLSFNKYCILQTGSLEGFSVTYLASNTRVSSQRPFLRVQNWCRSLQGSPWLQSPQYCISLHLNSWSGINKAGTAIVNTEKQNLNHFIYVIKCDYLELFYLYLQFKALKQNKICKA